MPVVLGADGTARVLLGVAAGDDPVLPQRREPPADIGLDRRIGVRAGGVVQRHVLPVGEVHLADRHPQVGARALDVPLVPADGLPGPAVGRCLVEAGVRASLMVMRPTPYAGITR